MTTEEKLTALVKISLHTLKSSAPNMFITLKPIFHGFKLKYVPQYHLESFQISFT